MAGHADRGPEACEERELSERLDIGYEPFAKEPEYIELNRRFIQSLLPYLEEVQSVLDLACGTGTMAELLVEEMQGAAVPVRAPSRRVPALTVLGVDISRQSLKAGQTLFRVSRPRTSVAFVEAAADAPPVAASVIDLTLMGNAIHLFTDKDGLVQQVFRVLRPGGLFAFNSSFYSGTMVPGTEQFYHEWLKASLGYIREKDEACRGQGMRGIVRVRGHGKRAFSSRWLSPAEYSGLLERHGFEVKSMHGRVLAMSQKNLESIGVYAGLAAVLLSGFPIPLASEALEQSVRPALDKVGVRVVPRLWLEVIAVKKMSMPSVPVALRDGCQGEGSFQRCLGHGDA